MSQKKTVPSMVVARMSAVRCQPGYWMRGVQKTSEVVARGDVGVSVNNHLNDEMMVMLRFLSEIVLQD